MSYCHVHGTYNDLFGSGCPGCRRDREELQEEWEREKKYREEKTESEEREREEREERELEREELREEREREREERRAAEEEELFRDYKRDNPGNYKCPECLYITLLRRASRCPHCQAVVPTDYWHLIYEQERIETKERERQKLLAEQEWKRGEPERQRKAKADAEAAAIAEAERQRKAKAEAEERERLQQITNRKDRSERFVYFYFGYLLPMLSSFMSLLLSYIVIPPTKVDVYDVLSYIFAFFCPIINWFFFLFALFMVNDMLFIWPLLFVMSFVGGVIYLKIRME